jgi:hypothetical protein
MSKIGFIAYIDESGDDGLTRIRPYDINGASEWFILSAVVVRADRQSELSWVRDILGKLNSPQRRDLHFQRLDDLRRSKVCCEMANLPLRCFVVMSNKRNMRGYTNQRAAKVYTPARNWFYWWMTRLLLERVTDYCERRSALDFGEASIVRLVFSRRGGLYYSHFQAYLRWLRMQSRANALFLSQGDLKWTVVDESEVYAFDHSKRAGLQLADAVAGAFFQSVHLRTTGGSEPKFAMLLEPRIAADAAGKMYGYGVKVMPGRYIERALPHQKPILEFYRTATRRRAPGP